MIFWGIVLTLLAHARATPRWVAAPPQAAWTPASTVPELKAAGGKKVVELGGQRVLLVSQGEEVYALSNKCSHLGLPLVGKTGLFQAEVKDGEGQRGDAGCGALLSWELLIWPRRARADSPTNCPGCVVCPAHGTAFDLATGAVKGESSCCIVCAVWHALPVIWSSNPTTCLLCYCHENGNSSLTRRWFFAGEWCPKMNLPLVSSIGLSQARRRHY